MHDRIRPAVAALSFLTAVPVGRGTELDERDLGRGAMWFPAVGAFVGLVVAGVAWAAARVVPPFAAGVLGVASGVALTAAFHLDGLGDVADGIGASLTGRPPAEVMKDPRLGTFGVAAVALDLMLQASLLAALVDRFPWEVVAAGAIARVAPLVLATWLPYAGGGTGGWVGGMRRSRVAVGTLLALALAVPTGRWAAAGMAAMAIVVTLALGRWSRRRLAGVTGDVFGAAAELTLTFSLAVAVAIR
jgi:adenosylcobinamide-GDP ribazoletransferase